MPKDTRKDDHPYQDNSIFPVVLAVAFLIAVAYGAYATTWDSGNTPWVDDRQAYSLPEADSLPVIKEIPTLYSSGTISGQAVIAGRVGELGLWLADSEHPKQTFAILSKRLSEFPLKVGQSVMIQGQVYRSEGLNKISLDEVGGKVIATLEEEKAFIYVEDIKRTDPID